MKKPKLFKINTTVFGWYILVCVITGIMAAILCYAHLKNPTDIWIELFKDIFVIVCTTFAVSISLGTLIEKESKKEFYSELVKNAIISDFFLKRLSGDEKDDLYEIVNKNIRCNGNENLYKIYADVEKRFIDQNFDQTHYYFKECSYDIVCRVVDGYIEKTCTKTMKFRPFDDKYTLTEIPLGKHSMKKVANKESFELLELSIDGAGLKSSELSKYVKNVETPLDNQSPLLCAKNKYDYGQKCLLKKKIDLLSNKTTTISYKYITRTELSDNSLTVRCSVPCEKFSVDYRFEGEGYHLKAVAFGFIDSGKNSPPTSSEKRICVEFGSWILPEDGVVVMLNKIEDDE